MSVCADPDLGHVLLEQKPSKGSIGNAIFLIILGAPMMAIILARNAPTDVRLGFFAFGAALVVFSLVMLWRNWMHVFLQERGICEFRQGRRRSLPYDQVDEVIYSSLRIFMQGAYMHTVQKLALSSEQTRGRPLICTYIHKETTGSGVTKPTAVTEICDMISRRLATKFQQTLGRQAIPWTPQVRVHQRGIELVNSGAEWELIEWARITRHEVDQSVFRVWVDGETKEKIKLSTTVPNFYPILMVVQSQLS